MGERRVPTLCKFFNTYTITMPRRSEKSFSGRGGKRVEQRTKPQEVVTPMDKRREEVVDFFSKHESCVLTAHTGAGKTTRGPEFLWEVLGPDAKIAVTVPRRGIATSVATYVAGRGGHTLGKEVGYQIRHDARVEAETALTFMTDGVMLRKLVGDPLLKNYDAVMVDEAHERNLKTDLTMGLLKQAQEKREAEGLEPLKVVISSATIEKEKFAEYFNTEATMEIEGKMFPVEESYLDYAPRDYTEAAAEQCQAILESGGRIAKNDGGSAGDILVFMPTKHSIRNTIQKIRALNIAADFEVLPFHSQVPTAERNRILGKKDGKRRIVVSTSIAEAGVTIPDVGYVVDSGLINEKEYDPKSGVTTMQERSHSLAGLKQRRGRAGRLTEGKYYGLYTQSSLDNRKPYSDPEIQRSDLSNVVLIMKRAGIEDVHNFDFLDHPGTEKINVAIQNLKILGALDEAGSLTEIGERMADLPADPEIARALVAAAEYDCAGDVATIAALLDENSVFEVSHSREREAKDAHRQFQDPRSDLLTLLNVWNAYDKQPRNNREKWAAANFLNKSVLRQAEKTRSQFLYILKRADIQRGAVHNPDSIGKSIAAGFIGSLMVAGSENRRGRTRYSSVHGSSYLDFVIDNQSPVDSSPDLCVAKERRRVNTENGTRDLLSTVQPVDPSWIVEIAPQLLEDLTSEVVYDAETGFADRHVSRRIKGTSYDLPLAIEDDVSPEERAEAFARYAADDPHKDFAKENEHNLAVAEEYNNLRLRYGGDIEENESFSGKFTRDTLKQIYGTVFKNGHIYSMEDLNRLGIDLEFSLSHFIPEDIQELIREENPETIVIDGKEHPVAYEEGCVSVTINEEDVFSVQSVPGLPSGRSVLVRTPDSNNAYDLNSLKERVRYSQINGLWRAWEREHPEKNLMFNFSDPEFSVPELPEQVMYAKDPMSNEDLFAYPALRRDGYGNYYLGYHSDKEVAERSHEGALSHIAEAVKEADIQRRLEIVLGGLHKVQEDITLLIEDSDLGAGEKPWLQNHSPHDLDTLREEVREALEVAHRHAPDAEGLLEDLRKKMLDISAVESGYEEAEQMVNEKIKNLLLERPDLGISSEFSLYDLSFGDVYVEELIRDRIVFTQYEDGANGHRYAVAAELLASDDFDDEKTVAQIIVRDDGLVRLADYVTHDHNDGFSLRFPDDGTRLYDTEFVWTGENLDSDSFKVTDYNIAPERVRRTIPNRKARPSRRQQRQRQRQQRLNPEFEDAVDLNTTDSPDEELGAMQAALQKALKGG